MGHNNRKRQARPRPATPIPSQRKQRQPSDQPSTCLQEETDSNPSIRTSVDLPQQSSTSAAASSSASVSVNALVDNDSRNACNIPPDEVCVTFPLFCGRDELLRIENDTTKAIADLKTKEKKTAHEQHLKSQAKAAPSTNAVQLLKPTTPPPPPIDRTDALTVDPNDGKWHLPFVFLNDEDKDLSDSEKQRTIFADYLMIILPRELLSPPGDPICELVKNPSCLSNEIFRRFSNVYLTCSNAIKNWSKDMGNDEKRQEMQKGMSKAATVRALIHQIVETRAVLMSNGWAVPALQALCEDHEKCSINKGIANQKIHGKSKRFTVSWLINCLNELFRLDHTAQQFMVKLVSNTIVDNAIVLDEIRAKGKEFNIDLVNGSEDQDASNNPLSIDNAIVLDEIQMKGKEFNIDLVKGSENQEDQKAFNNTLPIDNPSEGSNNENDSVNDESANRSDPEAQVTHSDGEGDNSSSDEDVTRGLFDSPAGVKMLKGAKLNMIEQIQKKYPAIGKDEAATENEEETTTTVEDDADDDNLENIESGLN